MKKILLIFLAFVINIFIFNSANAENFYIKNYKVNINVLEDRTAEITEDIDVFFTNESHGIFRSIPYRNKITREDGSSNVETASVTDITATEFVSKTYEGDTIIIKMGNPNSYVYGDHKYRISYKYKMGNDKVKDADEFYFNIIGTQWNTPIFRTYFTITLPKEFDQNNIGFSVGKKGTAGHDCKKIRYIVKGNTIKGVSSMLNNNEGITIRVQLPENYFIKTRGISYYVLIIAGILTLIPVILWAVFGKDDPVIPIVTFNPPDNKNSAEVEVEYTGTSTEKGITSLIFYLANKGYLEIENDGISYTIRKLKPYDGRKSSERALMDALFSGNREYITQIELEANPVFYRYSLQIQKKLKTIKGFLFDKESCSIEKIAIMILSVIGLVVLTIYTLGDYDFGFILEMNIFILFPIIAIIVLISMISTKNPITIIFGIVWSSLFGGIPLSIMIATVPNLAENWQVLLTEVCCLVVSIICLINMPKRNRKGRIVLGHILGLKKFLEVTERNRLLVQMNENPNYASEILPFAYVLGVADKIIDCIEDYSGYQPNWYKGTFNKNSFNYLTHSMNNSAAASQSRGSSGSHHSFGGGGGHSGGGHGGGGGGSW